IDATDRDPLGLGRDGRTVDRIGLELHHDPVVHLAAEPASGLESAQGGMTKEAQCLVCGGVGKPYAVKNSYPVHSCLQCGLIFVWPMPGNSLEVYEQDYFTG